MEVFLVHITAIIHSMFAGGVTMLLWFSRCLSTWFFVFFCCVVRFLSHIEEKADCNHVQP